jgi:protein SCO1
MIQKPMTRFLCTFSLMFGLLLGACNAGNESPPLEGAAIGGSFTLTDQDGNRVSDSDFAGKYRLVYFGFTYCPDVCPTDLQRIGRGLAEFEKSDPARAGRVQPIFISVDPERDSPDNIKEFVSAFHPRLIGLTGSPDEISDIAKRYGVFYSKGEVGPDGEYLMNHSTNAVLYGPEGQPITLVPHDQGPDAVAETLRRWVR